MIRTESMINYQMEVNMDNRNDYGYNNNYSQNGYDAGGYNNYYSGSTYVAESESRIITKSFLVVLAALIVTAITATMVVVNSALTNMVYSAFEAWLIVEIIVVIAASFAISKRKVALSAILFGAYCIVNGLTLSVIFFAYELGSIQEIFLLTAAMFAGMAAIGATTKIDLSKMGSVLIMALWGVIVVTLANMIFLHNSGLDLVMDYVGVVIFVGLTAYDTQKLKKLARSGEVGNANLIAIYCGMELYLDFINLFLRLLRILGRSRNN